MSSRSIIPYSRQSIDEDDIDAVVDVLKSDFLTQGPKVEEFEEALAEYCGSRYAVVFSSGTAALHGAYFAAGIGFGDEIITSPITFAATANAALYLGAKPVFVDVEPDTGNIDVRLIVRSITGKTKALVPIHYAGHPVDLDRIHEIARRKNLTVIEDACHALGALYKDRRIGGLSDMTVFSFHPVKPIATGEGGAVLTDDSTFFKRLSTFRVHGITKEREMFQNEPDGEWYYEMQALGFNYRLTDIQSALGVSQMKKLNAFLEKRRSIVYLYEGLLADNPWFDLPVERSDARSSWHLYPLRLKNQYREQKPAIFHGLRRRGIGVQVHYMPVYRHPLYQSLGYEAECCPSAEDFYAREVSVPLFHGMTEEDVRVVFRQLKEVLGGTSP